MEALPNRKAERERDEAYRALGRYLVEFSRLVFRMRDAMEQRLQRPDDPPALIQFAFNDVSAAGIGHSFFAMCREVGDLDDEEEKIRELLFAEVVQKAIPERNRIAHGDWWVGLHDAESGAPLAPAYTKTAAKKGEAFPLDTHAARRARQAL